MALTAANPGGWSLHEVLTSPQVNHLQNELLKAVDGVNGGTYTLASPLEFAGADVRIAADLEVLSGGEINIQSGAALNVLAGGVLDFSGDLHISSGGELIVESGGLVTFENGSDAVVENTALVDLLGTLDVNGTGSIEVRAGGAINVTSGGDINVTSADVHINGGAQVLVDGSILLSATGNLQSNGGDVILATGSLLTLQGGASALIEDAEDIVINDAIEGFRTMLVATGAVFGWEHHISTEMTWEQNDVTAAWGIMFPLAVRPGDTLIDLFVGINPENGHGALPATMPQIQIVRAALDGSLTPLATRADTSASTGTYEPDHFIVLSNASIDSGAMPILANDSPIYVIVQGEAGANSIAGLEVTSLTGNITARSYRNALGIYS